MNYNGIIFKTTCVIHLKCYLGNIILQLEMFKKINEPGRSTMYVIIIDQLGSLVVRPFAKCRGGPGSTGRNIIRMCLQCGISVKHHYKVVIISYVTSRNRPDMTWNVLKEALPPPPPQKNDNNYHITWCIFINFTHIFNYANLLKQNIC